MNPRRILMFAFAGLALMAMAAPSRARTIVIDVSLIGEPGNAADPVTNYGAVAYSYSMGKYDITLSQYAAFLNAVAKTDTYGLYNPELEIKGHTKGIIQTGEPGHFTYSIAGSAQNPVTYVSWLDAARFCNWLQNGQPAATGRVGDDGDRGVHAQRGYLERPGDPE